MTRRSVYISFIAAGLALLHACKHEPQPIVKPPNGGYPDEVARIFLGKCATAGCHNATSYSAAGGLLLDSWEHLFDGGNTGAVVVPYNIDYSSLLYFINPDSSLGITAEPRMPVNGDPLSKEEYITIRDWIASGAPDKDGNIPFATNPDTRQKVYAIHQGCDMVAVIDVEKDVVMRYIPIGIQPYPESPTHLRMLPDGRYAFAAMWYDHQAYKIDTYTDKVVGAVNMGEMFWSVLQVSADGQKALLSNGDRFNLSLVNTATLQVQHLATNYEMVNPHGIAANAAFDTFYVTAMEGNTVYRYTNNNIKKISIDNKPLTTKSGATPDPYDIMMAPDYSKYFISCAKSNELRIMDTKTDALIKAINIGTQPQFMAMSRKQPYLFVSCMEDPRAEPGTRGSVYVINYNTLEVVKKMEGKMYQPHSIAVDDRNNKVYVFSRNQNYDGPAPHHEGPCSGRNGFYSIFNLNTLEPVTNKKYEILVDPFVADIRFR